MKLFVKIFNWWKPLTILQKSSILDVWLGSEYVFDIFIFTIHSLIEIFEKMPVISLY